MGFRILALSVFVFVGYLTYNMIITKDGALSFALNDKENITKATFFWDLQHPIKVRIDAPKGIKRYQLKATTKDNLVIYEKEVLVLDKPKSLEVLLPKPEIQGLEGRHITYEFKAYDWSYAHFFDGNLAKFQCDVRIDTTKPLLKVLAHSPSIAYGGSALVVFEAIDENLSKAFVRIKEKEFEAFRLKEYQGRNIFISLVPWTHGIKDFKAFIVAQDKAYNIASKPLLFKRKTHRIKDANYSIQAIEEGLSRMELSLNFKQDFKKNFEQTLLKALNQTRQQNLDTFKQEAMQQGFFYKDFLNFKALAPMGDDTKIVGHFLENRRFLKGTQVLAQILHLGVDLRAKKGKPLVFQNSVQKIWRKNLEFFGDSALYCYGLGLCAFFSHLKPSLKTPQEFVGSSGFEVGGHLHMGVLVQGVLVRPNEWLSQTWIDDNIIAPLILAKSILSNNKEN
ncbi:hypothetical protein [Helicobacter cetorum]|uniref:Metalloendopeptidase related membrane protein n=1 Tax=Helicobacter cetorum (strain ATCC BAA-429 / MIT 00-7128) TaxID=182217 RepID=I0EM06_HELC0|nr:hypothetical protein [Helicobacter cetorum]AFI03975.1 metalloendopeptidase related membrane protein [Helicobacter cetorum MIT 00-7128]